MEKNLTPLNSRLVANKLISINAASFSIEQPFIYASGLCGPFYCDNRMALSHVAVRNIIVEEALVKIQNEHLNFDYIAGIATAGIPLASILADRLMKPLIYVRTAAKGHGKKNQVEGDFVVGKKALLVEDLVNQGKSLIDALLGVRREGLVVSDALCIVDYNHQTAKNSLSEHGLSLHSLTNFSSLVEEAFLLKSINKNEVEELTLWHLDPVAWSARIK